MTKPQASKKWRELAPFEARKRGRHVAFDMKLVNELGPGSVRRFANPGAEELFAGIGRAVGTLLGKPYKGHPIEEIGVTLLKRSELAAVRRPPASRLGRYSHSFSRDLVCEMLPESAKEPVEVKLGKVVVSRPQASKRYLIISARDAQVPILERNRLTAAIDEYEGVGHDWGGYQPHITLGSMEAGAYGFAQSQALKELQRTWLDTAVLLDPVE